jgi:hypothetical protein
MHVGEIFCDLAKTSDYVNHVLSVTLHYYGIQGTAANWFRSYLTNRKQKPEIKSFEKFSSKWGTVKHGVSQGSILGPLLFITYITDLPLTINTLSGPILLAYDTNVIISSKNSYDFSVISNTFVSHTSKWFTSNKLVLNLDKTNKIK